MGCSSAQASLAIQCVNLWLAYLKKSGKHVFFFFFGYNTSKTHDSLWNPQMGSQKHMSMSIHFHFLSVFHAVEQERATMETAHSSELAGCAKIITFL